MGFDKPALDALKGFIRVRWIRVIPADDDIRNEHSVRDIIAVGSCARLVTFGNEPGVLVTCVQLRGRPVQSKSVTDDMKKVRIVLPRPERKVKVPERVGEWI